MQYFDAECGLGWVIPDQYTVTTESCPCDVLAIDPMLCEIPNPLWGINFGQLQYHEFGFNSIRPAYTSQLKFEVSLKNCPGIANKLRQVLVYGTNLGPTPPPIFCPTSYGLFITLRFLSTK